MKTFHVQTLGCKVNHYESEQIATLLRCRGLTATDAASADLRVINTCSVTTQAASQSRQSVRRMVRLPVLRQTSSSQPACGDPSSQSFAGEQSPHLTQISANARSRVLVTGCWATSNHADASALPGVDGVLGHHQDVAGELDRLLLLWNTGQTPSIAPSVDASAPVCVTPSGSLGIEIKRKDETAPPAGQRTAHIEPKRYETVNQEMLKAECGMLSETASQTTPAPSSNAPSPIQHSALISQLSSPLPIQHSAFISQHSATSRLPLLTLRQSGRQRAFLKIQDGCDAHCTYCIIPSLRPKLWSKPIDDAVEEASALVSAGHVEIVLTGIFLGAYGQPTALRRRQPQSTAKPIGELIDALCTRVPGLKRLRLSSLEPLDLTPELIEILRSHAAVVPHFHLPLQSGSDLLLRRMNRQYTRDDFLHMIDRAKEAFDRPALTTDVVVGFPGETDAEFEQTIDVVHQSGFIHVHAFPYSPRPGTAAARWTKQFVRGPIVNERIERLRQMAEEQSFAYRSTFVGETVEVIVERDAENSTGHPPARHGRCERYFAVNFKDHSAKPGDSLRLRIETVTRERTFGRPA